MENEGTKLAEILDRAAQQTIRVRPVPHPYEHDLKRAAKRLRWLELIVNGLSYEEKRTTGALARRVKVLERRLIYKDARIKYLWHKIRTERSNANFKLKRERVNNKDLSWDVKAKIIKEFCRRSISDRT